MQKYRFQNKLSHWLSPDVEATAHIAKRSPESICRRLSEIETVPSDYERARVRDLVAWMVGCCFGRFDIGCVLSSGIRRPSLDPFDPLPSYSPAMLVDDDGRPSVRPPAGYPINFSEAGVLVDDPGHVSDITSSIRSVFDRLFVRDADEWWTKVGALLEPRDHDLRKWLVSSFFDHHLKTYSKSRRRAPVIWQIGIPSGRYSVWLYAHRVNRDTLFLVHTDFVAPKLLHEEKKLGSLVQSAGTNPSARERKEIAESKALVEELRSLVDEVKRVAPLWNPALDNGVVLSIAPLWRLVPQHKSWQKELKTAWDELVDETYDWSHAAMHFWPERVVPKSVVNRSLAISHGLEAAFWVQSISGTWRQRLGIVDTVRYLEENLFSGRLTQTVEELVAFSKFYASASGGGSDWWAALSTGVCDDTALALALWPERVIRKAVNDTDRLAVLGIKVPRATDGEELVAKLLSMHRPRLLDQELQALGEFCDSVGNSEYWSRRWEQFAIGFHDEYQLARAIYTPRVVAKSQTDPEFAKLHDLFRWFWLLDDSGPRRLKEPDDEIADALRIRSSLAVKAALKNLVEAPTATVSGARGRGRQPTTAAPAGGTY